MRDRKNCIEYLREKGFTENFTAAPRFRISAANRTYRLHEMKISGFYHYVRGVDSPGDSVLYAIETSDGKKGILIDEETEFMGERISDFIHAVNVARRKRKKFRILKPVTWLFRISFAVK